MISRRLSNICETSPMPIVQTANIANVIQGTIASAERVFEVLDEEEQLPDAADAAFLSISTTVRGEVRL